MIRGVEFIIPDEMEKSLAEILMPINIENSIVHLEFNEVYTTVQHNDLSDLFQKEDYLGHEFLELVTTSNHMIIFLELFVYSSQSNYSKIQTYEDFLSSECEAILLVADSIYASLYHKNESTIHKLYEHLKSSGYKEVSYLDENEYRYRMSVW